MNELFILLKIKPKRKSKLLHSIINFDSIYYREENMCYMLANLWIKLLEIKKILAIFINFEFHSNGVSKNMGNRFLNNSTL